MTSKAVAVCAVAVCLLQRLLGQLRLGVERPDPPGRLEEKRPSVTAIYLALPGRGQQNGLVLTESPENGIRLF